MSRIFLPRIGNPVYDAWRILTAGKDLNSYEYLFHPSIEAVRQAVELLGPNDEETRHLALYLDRLADDTTVMTMVCRQIAIRKYSFAIPSPEILTLLAEHGPLVEVGAGRGYWAALLREQGVDIVAFDETPPDGTSHANPYFNEPGLYTDVRAAPHNEVAAAFADRSLLLIWPPYCPATNVCWHEPPDPANWTYTCSEIPVGPVADGNVRKLESWTQPNTTPDIAFEAALAYERSGGHTILYIGEGGGGCTAGPQFHARIGLDCDHFGDEQCDCPPATWETVAYHHIPCWYGIHDRLSVHHRRVSIIDEE